MQFLDRLKKKWASLTKRQKILALMVGVFVLTGTAYVLIPVSALSQGDRRWKDILLGKGSRTIGQAGCLLTALTMATNTLNNKSLTPADTNTHLQAVSGVWNGSSMNLELAARQLGMSVPTRLRDAFGKVADMKRVIDSALQSNTVAIVHVSKDGDATGDHFVLVNGKDANGYVVTDPGSGRTMSLDNNLRGKTAGGTQYVAVGVAVLRSTAVQKA